MEQILITAFSWSAGADALMVPPPQHFYDNPAIVMAMVYAAFLTGGLLAWCADRMLNRVA